MFFTNYFWGSVMRDSMVFYRSYMEALSALPEEQRRRLFDAIIAYSLDDVIPDFEGVDKALFLLIKPQVDANNKRYENGKKGAESGKMGGRPPKNKQENNPNETPKKPLNNPNETPNANDNVNEDVKQLEEREPPTLEEITAYCLERNNNIDAQRFYDYYAATGWKIRGQRITDWQALVRRWESNGSDSSVARGTKVTSEELDALFTHLSEET